MTLTMYDDVTLSLIPANAQAVAGYVNGRWANYSQVVNRWPKAKHLSIAVTAHADADCLDVEKGDATNDQAPAWVKRQLARGVYRPVVYTSVSNGPALLSTLKAAGISRSQIRLWTAHYTAREHLCGPICGLRAGKLLLAKADATQWTDRALGRSLDQSLCSDGFFGTAPKPKPQPKPQPKPEPPVKGFGIRQKLVNGRWVTDLIRIFGKRK
jgi:hypothetical protein